MVKRRYDLNDPTAVASRMRRYMGLCLATVSMLLLPMWWVALDAMLQGASPWLYWDALLTWPLATLGLAAFIVDWARGYGLMERIPTRAGKEEK